MRKLGFITIAMLALCLTAVQAGPLDPHTITVSGYAEIQVKPDHATVDIGVVTSDKITAKALQANNLEMQRVVAAIEALGIADGDIQTSEFLIKPLHPPAKGEYALEDESVTLGYQVSNKVAISVTDLNKVPDIIDAAVNAGANSSNSVTFNVKNRAAYEDQELAAAVRDAHHNAEVMCSAEHASVGKMISMTNGPVSANDVGGVESVVVTGIRAPILPGQITIGAHVIVTYAIE